MMFALTCTCTMAIIHLLVKRKGVFGQSIISIISADLSPFGANSVVTFDCHLASDGILQFSKIASFSWKLEI